MTQQSKVLYLAQCNNLQDYSRDSVLREANDASRALFLLSKYHRQLPPAPTAARTDLWEVESTVPMPTTALGKIQQRAGQDLDFTEFLRFLALTSTLFVSYRRTAQAKELLDLLERRLLKVKQRVLLFRQYVEALVDGRENAGIKPALGSTEDATRQLAWYVSDHGISEPSTVAALDMMFGCRYYRRIGPLADDLTTSFDKFKAKLIQDADDADAVAVYVDRQVVIAGYSLDRVDLATTIVADAARKYSVRLPTSIGSIKTETTFTLKGFEFSAAGIVRK